VDVPGAGLCDFFAKTRAGDDRALASLLIEIRPGSLVSSGGFFVSADRPRLRMSFRMGCCWHTRTSRPSRGLPKKTSSAGRLGLPGIGHLTYSNIRKGARGWSARGWFTPVPTT